MKKLLVGLVLAGLLVTCWATKAQSAEDKIGSWYLVTDTAAFTPALNTNSSAVSVQLIEDSLVISVMGDFEDCLPLNTSGQIINKTLAFSNTLTLEGMLQCRSGKEKTDRWYPKGTTNSLLLNALLTGDKYLTIGTSVYASEGYSEVVDTINK